MKIGLWISAFNLFGAGVCFLGIVVAASQGSVLGVIVQATFTLINLGFAYINLKPIYEVIQ